MNIFERLVSGYPKGDVSPQDFIDHLTVGADGWGGAWIAMTAYIALSISPILITLQIYKDCFATGLQCRLEHLA